MWRTMLGIGGGGAAAMLIGWFAGRALSGAILGSMLGLAGLFCGAVAGLWWITLTARPPDRSQEADYDDSPSVAPPVP